MYLVTTPTQIDTSFDVYYHKINPKDKTWKSVLEAIERELESQYFANDEKLNGISFNIRITNKLPDDVYMEED
jgi:hypothetical protein